MHACIYVNMLVCTHAFTYVCTHAFMYVCMHVCMLVCMHALMYVCMYEWMDDTTLLYVSTSRWYFISMMIALYKLAESCHSKASRYV